MSDSNTEAGSKCNYLQEITLMTEGSRILIGYAYVKNQEKTNLI